MNHLYEYMAKCLQRQNSPQKFGVLSAEEKKIVEKVNGNISVQTRDSNVAMFLSQFTIQPTFGALLVKTFNLQIRSDGG